MPPNLTEREKEILDMKARGYETAAGILTTPTHKEIGEILGIAESTVDNHLQGAYAKLRVHDQTDAVLKAIAWGEIELPEYPLF